MILVGLILLACTREGPPIAELTAPTGDTGVTIPTEPTSPPTEPPDAGPTRAVYDRQLLQAELDAIRAARSRVRVAQFVMYDGAPITDLLEALEDAVARGVVVQVLADEEGDETRDLLAQLEAAGAETRLDSPATTLHAKVVLADDVAIVGSHNWTWSALMANHEGSVLVADAEVTAWYADWFDQLWATPDATPSLAPLGRADLEPLADRVVRDELVACIDGASEQVDVVMYAITWDDRYPGSSVDRLLTALEGAHARGVEVAVVVDASGWIVDNGINDEAIARLRSAGIPVWTAPSATTTHAKVLRCDDTVIVGDTNWTYTGLDLVHGVSVRATEPSVVAASVGWIADVRASATSVP